MGSFKREEGTSGTSTVMRDDAAPSVVIPTLQIWDGSGVTIRDGDAPSNSSSADPRKWPFSRSFSVTADMVKHSTSFRLKNKSSYCMSICGN